jgi:hypothetical protein
VTPLVVAHLLCDLYSEDEMHGWLDVWEEKAELGAGSARRAPRALAARAPC